MEQQALPVGGENGAGLLGFVENENLSSHGVLFGVGVFCLLGLRWMEVMLSFFTMSGSACARRVDCSERVRQAVSSNDFAFKRVTARWFALFCA